MNGFTRRRLLGAALASTLTIGLAACGGGDDDATTGTPAAQSVSDADVETALQTGGNLTVWAWEPTLTKVVEEFQKKYPNVKVNLANVGTSKDQYTALQNAFQAGNGIPDVAQIEYYALGQFALQKNLKDLGAYGATNLKAEYNPGPWAAVNTGGGVYGLPMDSGPMALFYNDEVLKKYNVEVPKTWTEYLEAARTIHKADPKVYITNDTGDAGLTTSLIWQAGGKPYTVDGTNVGINFADDAGTQEFVKVWQTLIDEKLLAPITSWSDQWFQGIANGSIATVATGAWMPANFTTSAPGGSGKWRAAELPQYQAGGTASAENGGSALSVTEKAPNATLAYGFLKFANQGEGVKLRVDAGAFPATSATLADPAWLGTEFEYFGGQKANEVFAKSAQGVLTGFSYLPFQVYSNSIFNDTVGQAYVSSTKLTDGLKTWQDQSAKYGNEQGFTVK